MHFIKQSSLLSDERLRNMAALVMVEAYFACVYRGKSVTLQILIQHIHQASKRFYGIPKFRFYVLASGI